jgi:uncharacterized protein YbjT (DUF2867 family)
LRVMVTGASGLIGSAITARLISAGHNVFGLARNVKEEARRWTDAQWRTCDIARMTQSGLWVPYLDGVDAIVNCAGVLQDGPEDSTRGVHVDGIAALFAACEQTGVRRVVHFSAIGVDREAPTAFSRTKLEGDRRLMASDLDWIILRPSVVVGRPAYGGSALFRGLASLPVLPVMPNTGLLQVVQLDDVADTVLFFLAPGAPTRLALDLAGPEQLPFTEVVRKYRRWLGWSEPRIICLPAWVAGALYRLGDVAGRLGWRPPLRSTARREVVRGAVGDPREWSRLTGITPQSLSAALAREPASVQERWFAALYLLKPVLFSVLFVFWILSGLLSIGPGYQIGVALMSEGGAGSLSPFAVIAGSLVDLAIGIGIAIRRSAQFALYAALAISVFYVIAGTIILPRLWIDPLGPMVKIVPIMVLTLVALAICKDR